MPDSIPLKDREHSCTKGPGLWSRLLDRILPFSSPTRLLLLFFVVIIQIAGQVFSWYALRTGHPGLVFLAVVVWVAWFGLVFIMSRRDTGGLLRRFRKAVYTGAALVVALLALMSVAEAIGIHLVNSGVVEDNEMAQALTGCLYYNDATALNHQASHLLIDGENPYSSSDIVDALEDYDVPLHFLTPLRQGTFAEVFPYPSEQQMHEALLEAAAFPEASPLEFESKVSYPAGSFLFIAPFVVLGMEDLRLFYLLCAVIMAAVLLWLGPRNLRPLILLAFVTNIWLWNLIGSGTTDTLYVLFIFLGWILIRRNILLSALFMGFAAATKQIAWLFILFYLVLLLRELGWKRTLQSIGIIGATFVGINLPFIFSAPEAWLGGVLAPVLDPMFPQGHGIVAFSILGILPPNSLLFTLIETAVLAAGLIWYYFNCRKYPHTGLLLAVLPLFFAWRSYSVYFCMSALIIFGVILVEEFSRKQEERTRTLLAD
ncbi:MAG: hypothetical protein IBX68_06835 [Dehalococcoidia bacterium]|nr:hypothetical protein [Dehalococcoidia bacterium]